MSGPVCPACGVAVVPGYVKCPKCHRPLPRFARSTLSPVGGTAVEAKQSNWMLWAFVGVVAIGLAYYIVHRLGDRTKSHAIAADAGVVAEPAVEPQPADQPVPAQQPTGIPVTVHADEVARSFGASLQRQRLWSTVTIVGTRVDVRGTACADAGMKPAIDGVAAQFHAAGLTKLRCLEQSGAVVFSRDL